MAYKWIVWLMLNCQVCITKFSLSFLMRCVVLFASSKAQIEQELLWLSKNRLTSLDVLQLVRLTGMSSGCSSWLIRCSQNSDDRCMKESGLCLNSRIIISCHGEHSIGSLFMTGSSWSKYVVSLIIPHGRDQNQMISRSFRCCCRLPTVPE